MNEINDLFKFLRANGWSIYSVIITGALFYLVIIKPENAEKVASWFWRLGAWIHFKIDKKFIASNIQSSINSPSKHINSEIEGVLPYKLKIEWVKEETKEAFLRKGEIIVRMRPYSNQNKNLVIAALLYVAEGLFPETKIYIEEKLKKSIDYMIVKKIFLRENLITAITYLIQEILKPDMQSNPEIKKNCIIMENLDKKGLFTRILLREILELGRKNFPQIVSGSQIKREIKDFVDFLQTIANKEKGQRINLGFSGTNININTVLIADVNKLVIQGIQPYVKRVKKCFSEGAETVYIFARGLNIPPAQKIINILDKENDLRCIKTENYFSFTPDDHKVKTLCGILKKI